MVSDKKMHNAFRIHKAEYTKPITDYFIVIIYQSYTLTLTKLIINTYTISFSLTL